MENPKIIIPQDYDEAMSRKEEVLKLINEYNEQLLNGEQVLLTEEEIDLLQEEYQLLDELIIESKDEDTELEEPLKFADKISAGLIVYMVLAILASIYPLCRSLGFDMIATSIFSEIDLSSMTTNAIKLLITAIFLIYPLILTLLSGLIRIFLIKKSENKKIFFWFYMIQILMLLVNSIIVFFTLINHVTAN